MLSFRNVSVRLDHKLILRDISFDLRPRRLTALVGRNGSGKSTLLSCVNRQVPYTGEIRYGEEDLAGIAPMERAKRIAYLPQMLPAPRILGEEMASFGRNPYLDFTGRLTRADREIVATALREANAEALATRYVSTLSGGERQRVALAMILAQNTPVSLLDEPTAHMDQTHETAFLRTLCKLKEEQNKTFLVALHDLNLAAEFADDMILLDEGKLIFAGTKEECLQQRILEKNLSLRRYTVEEEGKKKIFFSAE